MKSAQLILKNFAGQYCDVEINQRENGTVYLSFKSRSGYGYPTVELDELKELVRKSEGVFGGAK